MKPKPKMVNQILLLFITFPMLSALKSEESELDSEINRRILATSQYISYVALQRNTVPCSRRGASYNNCRPGAQANPYNRGCSAIARKNNGNRFAGHVAV